MLIKNYVITMLLLLPIHAQYATANTENVKQTIVLGYKDITVTAKTRSQIKESYVVPNAGYSDELGVKIDGPRISEPFFSLNNCTRIETDPAFYFGLFYGISNDGSYDVGNTSVMYSRYGSNYHWGSNNSAVTWTVYRGRFEVPQGTTLVTERWRCPLNETVSPSTPSLSVQFVNYTFSAQPTYATRSIASSIRTEVQQTASSSLTLSLWEPTLTDSQSKLKLLTGYSGNVKTQYELSLSSTSQDKGLLTLTDGAGRTINWGQVITSDSVYVQTAHRPGKTQIPVTLTIKSK
ncbi:hypothetical protein [Escherichia coli]|uniref:hypothetical protein n=1 Tax=Escherichia coli TaxID=562 RepID=UPI00191A47A0|nr:hypothetical protein [Escherichia coli]CAD6106237.1 Uncharacterised protein [Escherichia coli]CAD6110313.1 Uncharacterised protein [Escherichia coli]CAD6180697.1 Uncharacterised protein [Escherichia coli]